MKLREPKVIVDSNGCWLWQLCLDRDGYGQYCVDGRTKVAHRHYYELHKGAIPKGMQLDHTCCVRHCVNPDHLEPVTAKENARRTIERWHHYVGPKYERCKNGHAMTDGNTKYHSNGKRYCITCREQVKLNLAARYEKHSQREFAF